MQQSMPEIESTLPFECLEDEPCLTFVRLEVASGEVDILRFLAISAGSSNE